MKNRTIFRKILVPLLGVLIFEVGVMLAIILAGGVITKLNQNATDILAQQTENRGNYFLHDMIDNWSKLNQLSDEIDAMVQNELDEGRLELEDFNRDSLACTELLQEISQSLIDIIYTRQVSGAFVIFNTMDLEGETAPGILPGIYIRDLDPSSMPSVKNADLLWERAPIEVVRTSYIATDSSWKPLFTAEDSVEKDFFFQPFQTAFTDERKLPEKEYGYWTTEPYTLSGDSRKAISYSMPLILPDGTVYGVLGIELLTDYVKTLLPPAELQEDGQGTYILAVGNKQDSELRPVVLSSDAMTLEEAAGHGFRLSEDKQCVTDEAGKYYGAVKPFVLYSNNAPFDADRWYLLGISPKTSLFAFSRQMRQVLLLSLVLASIVGLTGILSASIRLSKPIRKLSGEVARAQKENKLPVLSVTGIREIDQFADSISTLSREVVESSTRLLEIIKMASVELAGYEIREDNSYLFVTENYFPLLGIHDVNVNDITVEEFEIRQKGIEKSLEHFSAEDGSLVYSVPQPDGSIRYFRYVSQQGEGRQVGLIEDVTASTLEKKEIERERDSDSLTRLYSRRGFKRTAEALFQKPEVLGHAGLLMIDLDNLKVSNDRFGHNYGDMYIQRAAECFQNNTPMGTVCARMSGDEFIVFFYGYETRDEIREKVRALYRAVREVRLTLPTGGTMELSASGGVAWYPEDSTRISELMKYADFAMYQAKRSKKGSCREFDLQAFTEQQHRNQLLVEFHQMMKEKRVNYAFQPIFDSRSGRVFSYEALMRVQMPNLKSPETVLKIARDEGKLHDIEYISIFHSTECFERLLAQGKVSGEALLFVNSIASECLTEEENQQFHERYGSLQKNIVVEITETESLDMELVRKKSATKGFSGMFALDDYGSGYNSEINLLELNPKFIKVDISIVRDVDKDDDKQQIIRNITEYAHKRGMLIVAEGLETEAELRTVIGLGVDLLQGYYLARPGEIPPEISSEALKVLREI